MIVICFTYSSIAPVLALAGVLYFALAYLIYKHQLLYVYVPTYETGGSLLPVFFRFTLVGLIFGNVTLLAVGSPPGLDMSLSPYPPTPPAPPPGQPRGWCASG